MKPTAAGTPPGWPEARPIAELHGVDRARFEREVLPSHEPVVLRDLVAHWPAVALARRSDAALADWLRSQASPSDVEAVMVPPQHQGRIFYAEGSGGFNFLRNQLPLAAVLEQLLRYAAFAEPPAVAVQSAPLADCMPAFAAAHPMPLIDAPVPRLWLGNAIVTPAHFDESHNIACVVAGQRRFTLFAPEQVGNLYVGPIGHAPTGTPISLVDMRAPDLQRHPRFAAAWASARQALLGPGDALYIPPLWWHHVASLAKLNLLVNYWWSPPGLPSGMGAVLHTLLALRPLPAAQRQAWLAMYRHWVFDADADTSAHLGAELLGVHGPLSAEQRTEVVRFLRAQLSDPRP